MSSKLDFQGRWAAFLQKRARRLNTSINEAERATPSVYLAALKEKAERLGISIEEVRQLHRDRPRSYPTPDCVLPSQLADFMSGEELPESVFQHLRCCASCWALLEISTPSEERLRFVLEEVRICVGERAVTSESEMSQLFNDPQEPVTKV